MSNLEKMNDWQNAGAASSCGAGDKPAEQPSACGAAAPAEQPSACGAAAPEEKPSACGASDK